LKGESMLSLHWSSLLVMELRMARVSFEAF
jgi:hypothetical protein